MNYFGEEAVTAAAAAGRSPAFYRSSWYRINYFFFLRLLPVLTTVGRSLAFYRSSWCCIDYFFAQKLLLQQ
jgi:hypothetical protein